MYSMSWLKPGSFVLLFLLFLITGCSSEPPRAKVKGLVKFDGKPLTYGKVAFITKDGVAGTGDIDTDGSYEISNAPVGEVTITVQVPNIAGNPTMDNSFSKPPPGMPPMRPPGSPDTKGTAAGFDPSKIVSIPPRYASLQTSDLKYTVERGEQTKNIILSP